MHPVHSIPSTSARTSTSPREPLTSLTRPSLSDDGDAPEDPRPGAPKPPQLPASNLHDAVLFATWIGFLYLLYAGLQARLGHPGWPLWPGLGEPVVAAYSLRDPISWMVLALCALPAVLVCCSVLKAIQQVDRARAVSLVLPRQLPELDRRLREEWEATCERALDLWRYEQQRAGRVRELLRSEAVHFGVLCSVSLSSAVLLVLPAADTAQPRLAFDVTAPEQVALAVGTAAAIFCALTLGKLRRRISDRNLSPGFLSSASQDLLGVEAAAAVLSLAALEVSAKPQAITCVLAGAVAALLGGEAIRLIKEKAISRLGVQPAGRPAGADLAQLSMLSEDTAARLREEGIHSTQALASTNIPRLFFTTRYPLDFLCRLQGEALLFTYCDALQRLLDDEPLRLLRVFSLCAVAMEPREADDAARLYRLHDEAAVPTEKSPVAAISAISTK